MLDDTEEHVKVTASLRCSDIECRIELADGREHPAAVGHVRPGAADAGTDVTIVRAIPPMLGRDASADIKHRLVTVLRRHMPER